MVVIPNGKRLTLNNMKGYFIFLVFITSFCYSQEKATVGLLKGNWMIKNESNEFYISDTLIFYKTTNPNKSIPKHYLKRPFIEPLSIFQKGTPRIDLELMNNKVFCSEISFSSNLDTTNSKELMLGKWDVQNNLLEIYSIPYYNWSFKIIEIRKYLFIYKEKEYSTIKMVVIKKKFENEDNSPRYRKRPACGKVKIAK